MFNKFKDIKIWKFYPNFELDFDIDIDTSLSFLINSTTNPRWKQKGYKVGVCSLARSTSRVEGHAGALGWKLEGMTSESIIHTNLHKPNNRLVTP